jgi:tRNA-dihydrouridine synthase
LVYSGLYDCGVRVFCIHGRTRGSTRHRRVGPANLPIIGQLAAHLHHYHNSHPPIASSYWWDQQVFVLSNGNITSPEDISVNDSLLTEAYCATAISLTPTEVPPDHWTGGYMSGEGILKNPAIFHRCLDAPSLFEIFEEYCSLSTLYYEMSGCDLSQPSESRQKQVNIARQHLNWMLGKSGHGRLIRYEYRGEIFRTNVDQMNALNEATTITDLLNIAKVAFAAEHRA